MYLRHLRVQNVKLLRDVQIDFTRPDGQPRMWTVFVGENRLCKTTLLQTIAAAAAGRDQAVHLTTGEIASWPDLRRPDATIEIDAVFGFGPHGHAEREYLENDAWTPLSPPQLISKLTLKPTSTVFEGKAHYPEKPLDKELFDDPLVSARRMGLLNWIVLGYGTSRVLRAPASTDARVEKDFSLDRLKSLFGADLIGTAFIEILEQDLGVAFVKILQRVLVDGGLLPHITAFELRGRGGIRSHRNLVDAQRFEMDIKGDDGKRIRIPAKWLSDGYQSVIAWIADLVGQILIDAREEVDSADIEGCVLIDEIDLRLHPTWQVRLIPALKKVFPRLQFIATTHSPMMLPALSAEEVYILTQDDQGSVVATPAAHSPALLTGSELYEEFFDIRKLYPNDLGDKTRRYGWLANDPMRSDEEDAQMGVLRRELDAAGITFEWEPVPREVAE
jgi:AAA domain, putative AbiEii toxin, Type IV TA system